VVSPQPKREAVAVLQTEHRMKITRTCGLINISDLCIGIEATDQTARSCASP
jgi:hypothetical protein